MPLPVRPMQAVSLQIPFSQDGSWYPSLVLDFTEDRELVVGVPMNRGSEVEVAPGTQVAVEIASSDGLRRYTAVVRARGDSPPSIHLTWPESKERIQRRDSVRVETVFRVELAMLGPGSTPGERVAGVSTDLSEGGMRVAVSSEVEPDTLAELTMHLPGLGVRRCVGHILRRGDILPPAGDKRYWIAIQFTDIAESVKREIIKLVFEIQRGQMRRG